MINAREREPHRHSCRQPVTHDEIAASIGCIWIITDRVLPKNVEVFLAEESAEARLSDLMAVEYGEGHDEDDLPASTDDYRYDMIRLDVTRGARRPPFAIFSAKR